jgi:hypothetical protein
MYPDRIHRLVVDGVVDAYDYTKMLWQDNLVDSEKDMDSFYWHCARVGYPRCLLAKEDGSSKWADVKNRTLSILDSLYHNPLPVIDSTSPQVITLSDIKAFTMGALYSPIQMFPFLAEILVEVEEGKASMSIAQIRTMHSYSCDIAPATVQCDPGLPAQGPGTALFGMDSTIAIACSDGDDQSFVTKDMFQEHIANLTRISPTMGDIWAMIRMQCIHYNMRAKHRFTGPYVGKTSHPILEIGNSADPVTPGRFAKKMAKGFEGAVALIQDSSGHCSLSAPSACTVGYVHKYFQTGELPPEDTVCKVDELPFGPTPAEANLLSLEDQMRLEHQMDIANALFDSGGRFLWQ